MRSFPGKVEASKKVELAFRVPGLLVKLPVREGQSIAKGEVIAQLRQDEFQARLKALQGQLDQARAALRALRSGERPEQRLRLEAQVRAAEAKLANARTEFNQRSSIELGCRRFAVASFQLGKEGRPLLLGAGLPHDLAPVQRLSLARRLARRPIPKQVGHRKRLGMRRVGVQRMHQRRTLHHQPDPRVATTVDPTLVALRQAKPTLQIEIVPDPFVLLLANEQTGQEAEHQPGHAVPDWILGRLEVIDQRLELLLTLRDILRPGLERRGHLRDHRDVLSDDLLLFLDLVQPTPDAVGQAAALLLREPPFFAPKFRCSEAWISVRASAIRTPGGWSGPP
ncbi:MAG: biotin/lipoyl-binding protein [Planctomycetaceae bacterium]|nr:biotin/lipoyl-binding protein [Planctomycetaceae bacterium]